MWVSLFIHTVVSVVDTIYTEYIFPSTSILLTSVFNRNSSASLLSCNMKNVEHTNYHYKEREIITFLKAMFSHMPAHIFRTNSSFVISPLVIMVLVKISVLYNLLNKYCINMLE